MNIGIIIQARLGSTRLPGKILLPFYGEQTIIDILLEKIHQATEAPVIIATTTSPVNDLLVSHLESKHEQVFRGAENDVLDRFIQAAEQHHLDGIIRICSDNPFLDPKGIQTLIEKAQTSEAQYIGFRINDLPSIKTHFGFWGEYVTLEALQQIADTTDEPLAHEHVTIHLYSHPEEYCCEWIDCPDFIQGRNDIRLTVDTQEDFDNAQKVYADLKNDNPDFGLEEVVEYIDRHEELKSSMKSIIERNAK